MRTRAVVGKATQGLGIRDESSMSKAALSAACSEIDFEQETLEEVGSMAPIRYGNARYSKTVSKVPCKPSSTPTPSRKQGTRQDHDLRAPPQATFPAVSRNPTNDKAILNGCAGKAFKNGSVHYLRFPKNSISDSKRMSSWYLLLLGTRSRTNLTKRSLRLLHSYVFTT